MKFITASTMSGSGDWSLVLQKGPASSDVAIPSAECGELQITLGSTSPTMYKDPETGQLISHETITESLRQLDEVKAKLEAGRKVYNQVWKDTNGDVEQAKLAGNEAAGGSFTQLMDGLCTMKVLVTMVVVCPPCPNKKEMYANEARLKIVIRQLKEFLYGQICDLWTSRNEIGSINESFVYVRFPYYLTEHVMTLATALSQVNVGPHQFRASVTYDGRAKLTKSIAVVEQWEIEIAGHKIPALSREELAAVSAQPRASYEQQYKMRTESDKTNTFSKDGMDEDEAHAELSKFLYAWEIARIYEMQTYRLSQLLQSPKDTENLQAYFQIAGLVIEAAAKGVTDPCGLSVRCFEATTEVSFHDSPLWLSTKVGNCYLTLDTPFETNIGSDDTNIQKDGSAGCIVTFCLQYTLGGPSGMHIVKGGLAFVQHLSSKKNFTNIKILANVMKQHLAGFSANIACMQARTDHAAATSSSKNQSTLTQ